MIALNDKSERTINFDQNSGNESTSKNFYRLSISWPSYRVLWISIHSERAYVHTYVGNSAKSLILLSSLKWGYIQIFGYLYWYTYKWRHRYDSYNLNLEIKSSDSELVVYLKRLMILMALTMTLLIVFHSRMKLKMKILKGQFW